MKKLFLILTLFCSYVYVSAENITISGVIKDYDTQEPLIGVNVFVKGTSSIGTITDIDGVFKLEVPNSSTIQISYIGYETAERQVANTQDWNILLKTESINMDEFVVTGYSIQRKRDVLGAVAKVDGSDLNKVVASSAQQALQGRVAGVQVSSSTGAPGASVSVRIRGVGSISSSNDPLYIVDGIPVEGALNNLSPNEIESMTVLKDASSAAVYGSRANNGVILITTKGGKAGKTTVSYSGQVGVQQAVNLIKMADTRTYINMYNEAARTDNATSSVQRTLIEGEYIKDFADVDHQKEIMSNALLHTHEVSITGGTDKIQYLVLGSYFDQEGIIKGTGYNRFNVRSNINADVKKWLTIGLNATGGFSNTKSIASSGDGYQNSEGGSVVRYALFRNPAIPSRDANGGLVDLPSEYYGNQIYNSFFGDGYSPEGLVENNDRNRLEKYLVSSANIRINLPANLIWKTVFGVDYKSSEYRQFNKTWGSNNRINSVNSLNISNEALLNWSVNSTLNQFFTVKDVHNMSYMAGFEAIGNKGETLNSSDQNFVDNNDSNFHYIGKGMGPITSSQSIWEARLLSFFGTFNYNFNNKYYVSATLRGDGSSRFSKGNQWGVFYSASAGWNIESEDFMKDVASINKFKLRAGYGSIGNQNIGLYAYNDRYASEYYYPFGGVGQNGYVQTVLGNTDLKWETCDQFNVGVDMEFLKGIFGFSVDYFYKVTSDMLVQSPLPPSVGTASTPWINSGNVLNTGVDLELFFRKSYKNGGFDINLNGGYLHNRVLSLDAPIQGARVDNGVYATRTEVGYPIGSFYLYEMDGIFQNSAEILGSAYQGRGIAAGDVKYVDQNNDNVIDSKDRVHMGSAIPTVTMGLNLAGDYKGFDVSLFFQGAFGQKIYNQINHDIEGFYRGFNVTQRYADEHWTPENPSNTQPRASWTAKGNNVIASSRFLEDGSYFRLKNVQLGYSVNALKKYGVENLRFYIAATNLFTLTKYSGMDPEMTVSANSSSEGDRASGVDWGTYPVARTFTFGLNITF